MNLNKVILIGRIANDINLFDSKSGIQIARFRLAITRENYSNSSNEEITDFIEVVAFRNNATFISKFFNKGDLVSVVGSLQSSQYTSTKTGDVVTSLNVVIDQIKSLEPRSVTQARAERKNTTIANNTKTINNDEATFYNETNDNEKKDSPWELEL